MMRRLETLRRACGWTRTELGRRARVDNSRLAKIEAGRVVPYPPELRRLARAVRWRSPDGAGLLDDVTPAVSAEPPIA
jgi:transcriptional regulator with XRE-family HTH domain